MEFDALLEFVIESPFSFINMAEFVGYKLIIYDRNSKI